MVACSKRQVDGTEAVQRGVDDGATRIEGVVRTAQFRPEDMLRRFRGE